MKRQKTKFYESIFLGMGISIMSLCSLSLLIIIYRLWEITELTLFQNIYFIGFFGFYPIILCITLIHRGFSLIEFNEKGIKKSLFKIFRKKQILWSEVVDTKVLVRVTSWLFISKVNMDDLSYDKLVNHKDVIHIQLSKEVIEAYNRYSGRDPIELDA